jgi:hypothetical protein
MEDDDIPSANLISTSDRCRHLFQGIRQRLGYREAMRGRGTVSSATLAAALACALALAACGGSGSSASSNPEPSRATPSRPDRYLRERASDVRLSRADCAALASEVEGRLKVPVRRRAEPTPPLSRCRLTGPGTSVNVYLDAAYAARQRYKNRMVEQAQFGAPDPAKLPHPVAGVGDRVAYDGDASWVPAYHSLFAVRGNRWLTVAYSAAGEPDRRLRANAAALARSAFRLSTD